MNRLKVSVIVPFYNEEKYLLNCFESLNNQTYKNIEFLLINDGSNDKSLQIANDITQKYSYFSIYNKKHCGQGECRNFDIDLCKGDYIAFVDADDYVDENYIKNFVENIEDDIDLLFCCKNRKYKLNKQYIRKKIKIYKLF